MVVVIIILVMNSLLMIIFQWAQFCVLGDIFDLKYSSSKMSLVDE